MASLIVMAFSANAQFYYKDVISNKALLDEMAQLKDQKIKKVNIKSFEDDGSPSDGFFCEKKISRNYTFVQTTTRSNISGASIFSSTFSNKGLLEKTVDSSDLAVTTSIYTYDENDRLKSVRSAVHSSDDDFTNDIIEVHTYYYDEKGFPSKMIRLKGSADSTVILFSPDDKNNVSIEKDTKTGKSYYYYYDGKKRLTDVVHLNEFNQQMLPDYMFEYNNAGNISQMTTTEEGGSYYYIWKYTYDNGLRTKEKCFSKERRLMGSIEYEYE